jgi:hypothetical protein
MIFGETYIQFSSQNRLIAPFPDLTDISHAKKHNIGPSFANQRLELEFDNQSVDLVEDEHRPGVDLMKPFRQKFIHKT